MRIAIFISLLFLISLIFSYTALLEDSNTTYAPPTISVESPSEGQTFQDKNVTFKFTYDRHDSPVSEPMCALYLNGTMAMNFRAKSGTASIFYLTNVQRATYKWQLFCEDAKTAVRTFTISKLPPPTVSLSAPPGGSSFEPTQINFSFTYRSNEDELPSTICRLSVNGIVRKEVAAPDGERLTLEGIDFAPGTYSWAVQCDARGGKKISSEQRVFFIKVPKEPKNATSNQSDGQGENETLANQSAPSLYRLSMQPTGAEGTPFLLMLIDPDSKPTGGIEIIVLSPDGKNLSAGKTDALGRLAYTPAASGKFQFFAGGVQLDKEYIAEIARAYSPNISASAGGASTPTSASNLSTAAYSGSAPRPEETNSAPGEENYPPPHSIPPAFASFVQENTVPIAFGTVLIVAIASALAYFSFRKPPLSPPTPDAGKINLVEIKPR